MNKMVTLVFGANGNIGQIIAEREAENSLVVGTYRKDDAVTRRLKQHSNIETSPMTSKVVISGCDFSHSDSRSSLSDRRNVQPITGYLDAGV